MPEHPDRPPIKAPPLPGPPTEKKPEETKALVPSTRPPILDLNPDVIKHLKKRKLELGEGPLVPVEKGGKPVFFSAEVPKIFVPDEFVNFDPVLKNLDLLSPSSSYWMDFFGGLAETPFGKKAQGLTESKILGPIFNLLIEASETAEKFVGYGYQAFFEPELRTPDAIGFLMSRNRKLLTDPQFAATVIQSGIYTAKQRNILGAWWAARQTYEALKLGESGPGIAIRTALKASPVFALLGKENKEVTILMWKLLGRSIGKVEQAPAEERAVGPLGIREADIIGVRQIEITDEEMALLHKWDLDWIFASLTDPEQLSDYVLEKQQRFMDYNEAFINGTYYREYFGLPILVDMRLAIMNGADPDLVQGAYTEGLGALAFEAQLDNMIFGSMIDPINLVSLAPVGEGVKFIRNVALTSRLAPKLSNAVDDILRLSSKLDDLAKVGQFDLFGDALKDLRKVADDLDLGRFTKVVDDIERAVGAGGKPHSGSLYAKTEEVLGELRNVVISPEEIAEGIKAGVAMKAGTIIQNVDPNSGLITKWKKIGGKKAFAGQWRQLDSAGVETAVIVGADSTEGANIVMRGKQIGEVVQSTAELRKAIKGFEPVMKDWSELHRMSYVERIIVAISGGDPLNPASKWDKLGTPWRINPISLSASARAQEFVSGLHNALTPLLREAADWKAMVKVIKAGAAGIFGRRFGHAFVSPVGRYVQTILKRMTEHVTDLAEVYVKTAPQRAMANSIARISGMDIVAWMQRASAGGDDVAVLWKQFTKALIGADETIDVLNLRKLIADGLLSEDTIKNLGELFKSTPTKIIPYTDDLFRAEILRHSIDVAAEYAVKHFGVKEARSIQKFANYIKAPESLLLLGFNPFYPVLNFFNGETTMMFRGTWGLFAPRRWIPKAVRKFIPSMEDTWEAYRMEPARLHEGFSVAGLDNFQDVLKASAGPEKAALASGREMIRATVAGEPGKIGRIYFNAIAKVRGMRALAAATESWESARITTVAFQKAIRMLKSSYSKIDQVVPGLSDEIRVVDRALVGVLEDAVKSGRNSDEILAVAKAENITINLETLLRRTAESMGLDSKKMSLYVGEEINEIVRKTLVNLGPNPSADNIRDSFRQIGDFVQNYLDETVGASIPIQIAEAATKTEAEGPRAVLQLLSEASQTLFDRRASHMKFLDNNLSDVWEITDVALRDATFKAVLETADASWNRYWNLAEAVKRGIEKGLKARGMDVPDSFLGSMVRERMGAQTFIKLRNKLWTEHVGKLKTKKEFDKALRLADRAAIQETLDLEYMKLIDLTVASRKEMDGIFQLLMPEGTAVDLRNAVAGWREVIVRAVRADMEGVIEHRQNIRGLSPQAKAEAWTRFGEARRGADIELGRLEDAGYLMLNGDEQATRYFVQQAQELGISAVDDVAEQMFTGRKVLARVETESLELLEKSVSGKTLTPDEGAQVDKLVKRFLTETERAQLDELERSIAVGVQPPTAKGPTPRAKVFVFDSAVEMNAKISAGVAGDFSAVDNPVGERLLSALDQSQEIFDPILIVPDFVDRPGALARVNFGFYDPATGKVRLELSTKLFKKTPKEIRDVLLEEVAHYLDVRPSAADKLSRIFGAGEAGSENAARAVIDSILKRTEKAAPVAGLDDLIRRRDASMALLKGSRLGVTDKVDHLSLVEDLTTQINRIAAEGAGQKVIDFTGEGLDEGAIVITLAEKLHLPEGTRLRFDGIEGSDKFRMVSFSTVDEAGNPKTIKTVLGTDIDQLSIQASSLERKPFVLRVEGEAAELTGKAAADAYVKQALDANPDIRKTLEAIADTSLESQRQVPLDDMAKLPMAEMPRELRVQVQWIAQQMMDDIQIAEPGSRAFFYDRGPGVDVIGLGSGRPPWYNQFLETFNTDRTAVLKALKKIVDGENDRFVMVERLKFNIFGDLIEGPRGSPPDPVVLRILGQGQDKIDEAMELWKQTGFDPLSEAAASQHAERLQLNHSVLTRIYEEFEAGAAQISKDMNEIDDAIESAAGFPVLPEFDRVVGRQLYQGTGFDELWFEHGATIVQKMEREAIKMLDEPSRRISDLPASTQSKVMQYLDHMVGEFRDVRQAAIRIGEGQRDTALLNYSRTYNVDNWLAVGLPFHFWYTHSVARWALSALDRPMILANYAKLKLFMDNVMGQNEGFPQRLRGHVKIEMPFAPEEAGDIYVNPFRIFGLPFEQFTQPFERAAQKAVSVENRVIRTLDELLEAQTISKQQHEEAIVSKEGELWDRARVLVENDEDRLRFDMLDFMNLSISPHVPIQIAWNLLRGTPEELNPLPHTRGLRHVATALGIDVGVYDKVWGNVRQAVGLPAFDQYDPYRARRELSNFLGEGKIIDGKPVVQSEILLAMATEEGELYDQARQVVAEVEKFRYFSRFFGIPANPYPPGEENLRSLYNEFYGSFRLKDQGDDRAMGRFFDAHPEFEARLALWKTPEEQLRSFLVDQVWNWWWDAPKIHRDEAKVQLGDLFALGFINKETRATDAISLDVLTTWVHLLGGTAPGQLELSGDLAPLQFTDPVVANKLQVFYDIRSNIFDYSNVVWPLQQEYFRLDKGDARKAFALAHDVLPKWWTYRRDFMIRNPDLIPYIEDDPERQPTFPSEAALRAATAAQPDFSKFEWQQALGGSAYNLTMDLVVDGDALPMVVRDHLDAVAEDIGISGWRELVSKFAKAHRLEEPDRPLIQVPQDERILEQVNILE